ncbi:MAG: calcium/sodium antiporter [Bradymonadia bacterium]
MLIPLVSLIGGLVVLVLAADKLVDGAVGISRRLGISTLVVGLTVVAYGTSLPEFIVSILASFNGVADFAIGNIVGSNIANIGLVLGSAAAIQAIMLTDKKVIWRDFPTVLLSAGTAVAFMADGQVARWEGIVLALIAVVYTVLALKTSKGPAAEHIEEMEAAGDPHEPPLMSWTGAIVRLLIGGAGLFGGAHFMVEGATEISAMLGIPDRIVGLTVVAIGTSLPEMAASMAAALKKHPELALGNVIGSCIFNVSFVLGGMAIIRPVPVSFDAAVPDLMMMGGLTLAMVGLMWTKMKLSRLEGGLLVFSYLGYLTWLVLKTLGVA